MLEKEYDLFMNMLRNPDASFNTFVAGGLTTDNTLLLERSEYESSEKVLEALKDQYGQFDKTLFNQLYDNAKMYYNLLSSADYDKAVQKQISYHRDDIFAPADLKRTGHDYILTTVSNPYKITSSIFELGKIGERTKSIDELAQSNKVLLNPTTAGDNLENAQWGDSPNDNFSGYFFNTLVLAQYDEDGTHKDPITGDIIQHLKGDLKLDLNGDFYYEKLDGRDVYGRRVLNKMNVLTTDGSFWNKYDFFDSDDINLKSVGGSILKNLALVGTMFIPYVGPWIAGISIVTLLAGLGATLGKMIAGSDNPTLSEIEGWSKSVSRLRALTEYALENTWCWENFINLIGDVAALLKELRFIFKQIPYAVSGTNIYSKESVAAKLALLEKLQQKLFTTRVGDLKTLGKTKEGLQLSVSELRTRAALNAQSELDSFIKGYLKLGEVLSKGYMTAITVGDTYGEAKLAGASDLDATLLTLGYAAGEYALLNTGLGEWILPELRVGRYKAQAIAKALANINLDTLALYKQFGTTLKNVPKEGKKLYVKKIFNIGKNIARAEYANGSRTIIASLAAGAGEGVEEVSEELLADFSKGCYDVVKWLQGEDTRLDAFGYNFNTGEFNLNDIVDRYGMSLIGGFVGGSLTNIGTNYKGVKDISNMTSQQAIQEMVYMSRNGQLNQFLKEVNKIELGDKNLSVNLQLNNDGTFSFIPGTEQDNLDVYIKKAINLLAKLIELILQSNGASLSDESFLDKLTLNDLRFTALHNSSIAGELLNEFNGLSSQIVHLVSSINTIYNQALDSNEDNVVSDREKRKNKLSSEQQTIINKLEKELKEKLKSLQDLLDGKRSYEFIADALFEMTPALSGNLTTVNFPLFAEQMYGRKFADLTNNEKAIAKEKYDLWKSSEGREHIKTISTIFRSISLQVSSLIKLSELKYTDTYKELLLINEFISLLYINTDSENWIDKALELVNTNTDEVNMRFLKLLGTKLQIDRLDLLYLEHNKVNEDSSLSDEEKRNKKKQIIELYRQELTNTLLDNINYYIEPFIERGFANVETKQQLDKLLFSALRTVLQRFIEWEYQSEENFGNTDFNQTNPYADLLLYIIRLRKEVLKLNQTPIEEDLNLFSISIGNEPINISELEQRLNAALEETSNDVTKFNIEENVYLDLLNAINTLKLYKSAILAARTDSSRVGDLFGYNATLNDVAEKIKEQSYPELAEINSLVADLFVSDIDTTLNKLLFLQTLYEFNSGLKLNRLDKVAIKKDLLIYKRLKAIVLILDDDELKKWNGFLLFLTVINGMTVHEDLLRNNSTDLSKEQRLLFEKEALLVEDAIYNFFLSNQEKLNDPKLLAQLLNPNRLQLYVDANEILNESLNNLDDNSIVWWLASRAAVKSSDFYNQYRLIIDPKAEHLIAPIATQELAIYNNYASIVNGNIFTNFYKAYRYAMLLDWRSKTVDLREEILNKLGKSKGFAADKWVDYAINFLPLPRYLNIVLTEGIPGSGKSTAVYASTIKLLQRTHPELLKNVAIVHGANADSATKLRNDIGLTLDNSITYGRDNFMREINPEWKEYQIDPISLSYLIPKTDYTLTNENEIVSALGIKDTQNPPSLIIIDEISKFSSYDIDLIDKYAKKYGITVLVAGDFDLTGVIGSHPIAINGENRTWKIELERLNFIRSPKLGVSMRTDNSIKTTNLNKLLAYLLNYTDETVTFDYYEDETGLYGDKVILYDAEIHRNKEGKISEIVDNRNIILTTILEDINKLIDTLKEGEKIGYIYSNQNSPIFKELSSDKYNKYIDFKEGGSAQGLEGRYYIIESEFNENTKLYLKDIYTGMSRAQLGSLIIAPYSSDDKAVVKFDSKRISKKIDESLSKLSIANFTDKRQKLLNQIAATGNSIPYTPRTSETVIIKSPTGNSIVGGLPAGVDPTPPPSNLTEGSTELTYELEKEKLLKAIEENTDIEEINRFISEANLRHPGLDKDIDVINALNKKNIATVNLEAINKATAEDYKNIRTNIVLSYYQEHPEEVIEELTKEAQATADYINGKLTDREYLITLGHATSWLDDPHTGSDDIKTEAIELRNKYLPFINTSQSITLVDPKNDSLSEPLIYEDNATPITPTDIIPETNYEELIDNSNEGNEAPQSLVIEDSEHIIINMLLHTFNTFETGVLVGEGGKPVPVGSLEWMDARIDSINGLIKIDKLLGKPIKTVKEYIRLIGRLRSILFNTLSKSDICTELQKTLGLSKIYCTFALKSSPRPSNKNRENNTEFVSSEPYTKNGITTTFDKGISEQTMFNGSSDIRSHEWHQKSIVAVIGSEETGDILELPLLALSSSFTLILTKNEDGSLIFGEMYNRFNSLKNSGISQHEIVINLINEFDGNAKYQDLVDLFKLFNFTDGGIFYIRDSQWTPFKDLELLGPSFVKHRGYYLDADGLSYDRDTNPKSEWMTVDEFANSPEKHNTQSYVTSKVMISNTGMVDAGDKSIQIVNPGHPFVLVSYDLNLNNDKKVIDYFIKLETDLSTPKKVKLVYVIPPKATIREYLGNILKIFYKDKDILNIGLLFTSYKLLKILTKNDSFRRELERKSPGLLSKVDKAILEVDNLETIQLKKDKLYEKQDWSKEGISAKPVALAGIFDNVLISFAFTRNTLGTLINQLITSLIDETATLLIEAILGQEGIDGVYYNSKTLKNNPTTIGPFIIPILGDNYTINNKPYRIHGKIDSYTFRGNMNWLVSYALSKMISTNNGHILSTDSFAYRDRNSNLNQTISPQLRAINDTLKYLQQKTGKDFSQYYLNGNIREGNAKVVDKILREDNGMIAFTIGDIIRVSNPSEYLKGIIGIVNINDDIPTLSLDSVDNNGKYLFRVATINNLRIQTFNAEYDSKNDILILTPEIAVNTSVLSLSVTPENLNDYLNEGREILESIFDFDPTLSDAFLKTNYDEFMLALDNLEYIGDDRINDLSSLLENATPMQKLIINDLIELEKSHDPEKQDPNDLNLICPTSFKIKF